MQRSRDGWGWGGPSLVYLLLSLKKDGPVAGLKPTSSHKSRPIDSVLQEYAFADYSSTGNFYRFLKYMSLYIMKKGTGKLRQTRG